MKRYIMILAAGLVAGAALADTIITPTSVVLTDNGNSHSTGNANVIDNAGGDAWFDGSGLSDATIVKNGHPFVLRHRRVDCLDDHHYPFDQ